MLSMVSSNSEAKRLWNKQEARVAQHARRTPCAQCAVCSAQTTLYLTLTTVSSVSGFMALPCELCWYDCYQWPVCVLCRYRQTSPRAGPSFTTPVSFSILDVTNLPNLDCTHWINLSELSKLTFMMTPVSESWVEKGNILTNALFSALGREYHG